MIIAVNTGFTGDGLPGDDYSFECLSRLAEKYPRHQFIYIFNEPHNRYSSFGKNITEVIAGPKVKNSLLIQYWLNYKLPSLLKKYKADVLLNMNGMCSLRTKVPQCLFVQDLSFLKSPLHLSKTQAGFLKKFTPRFLAKAKTVVTVSGYSRSVIIDQYKITGDKADVVYGGINEIYKPLTQHEKEIIKEKYTGGKEYFISHADHNLVNLLKAFSFFKKRQKSNMMLLMTGKTYGSFKEELKTFKFRNEVLLLEDLPAEELAKITASAYTNVHPVLYDELAIHPLRAMQCEVPVVCSNTGALPELCGPASLFFNPGNFEDMAEKMMLVFKDEDKAKELVKAGKIQAGLYDWDKTAGLLWRSIQKAVNT